MSEDICELVITGPSGEWAATLARRLVDARLVACGHVLPAIRSIYRWDEGVQDEGEARVALHTRRSLVPAIVELVNSEHPYDVPCVIALPILGGNPAYVEWVLGVTA